MKTRLNRWFPFVRPLRLLTPQAVIAAIATLLLIVDTFVKPLSTVALGLIVVGLSPWVVKYVARVRFQRRANEIEPLPYFFPCVGLAETSAHISNAPPRRG